MNEKKITKAEAELVNGGYGKQSGNKCPNCGSGFVLIDKIKNNEAIREASDYIYICNCRDCGFKWSYRQ